MPFVISRSVFIVGISLILAVGCSDARKSGSGFDANTGRHITGWLPAGHSAAALSGGSCTECHGADLSGGIAGVSCTACHLGGPTRVHPATWTLTYKDHGPYSNASGTTSCANQYCHGTTLAGVAQSGPSCTACHNLPFDGTVICTACHKIPPAGNTFPNTAGKHAKHMALLNITCSVCHNGAGSGTTYHMNGTAEVFFAPAFNSKASTAAYDRPTATCSNVTCHGGPRTQDSTQASTGTSTKSQTPSWFTGSINVATQCTSCHVYGADEYNSYVSGQHSKHVYSEKIFCTDCHDPSQLAANHFTTLNTTAMEGNAAVSLRSSLLYNATLNSCNPEQGGLTGCHSSKNW